MFFLILIIKKCLSFFYNINNLNRPAKIKLSPIISTAKIALVYVYIIN